MNRFLRQHSRIKIELRELLELEAWHRKDPPTTYRFRSILMDACNYNEFNFIIMLLLNPEKRFMMQFVARIPGELGIISDQRVPMLEIWADRGHF